MKRTSLSAAVQLSRCKSVKCRAVSANFPIFNQQKRNVQAVSSSRNDGDILAQTQTIVIPTAAEGVQVDVKAYFIAARGIDVIHVEGNLYGNNNNPQKYKDKKSMIMTVDAELNQYISIFKYGSCVFFNIPVAHHLEHIRRIKEISSGVPSVDGISSGLSSADGVLVEGLQHNENYKIIIHKNLSKPSVIKAEHVNIRCLDINNLVIIGTVMAQTVALDYYAETTEKMLKTFTKMNISVEESGNFNHLDKKSLYKLVASNNTVITNLLSKLGIFEGSDAAWENADYYTTWEALRNDFELDNRFRDLSLKLDMVKDNAKYFLEMAHNNKSTKLEW
eukprot:CAMPEP_0119038788 /NCGR_PEP_ID=MMETSP1177-20130426/7913_1 /TAXON_ID=2985 /ORGANISM="Ochromonas sp, Strain CCMP1899" /LENGTH=333 /DNA_ID=CAMNT_0007001819 /DNA_START=126 /DNA_END=1124 /DNA_ORIENTATION=-